MRKPTYALLLLLASGCAFAQAQPATSAPEQQAEKEVSTSDDPDAAESATKIPLDEIRRYVWVYNAVKEAYVDPVDDRKLMDSAVRASEWGALGPVEHRAPVDKGNDRRPPRR